MSADEPSKNTSLSGAEDDASNLEPIEGNDGHDEDPVGLEELDPELSIISETEGRVPEDKDMDTPDLRERYRESFEQILPEPPSNRKTETSRLVTNWVRVVGKYNLSTKLLRVSAPVYEEKLKCRECKKIRLDMVTCASKSGPERALERHPYCVPCIFKIEKKRPKGDHSCPVHENDNAVLGSNHTQFALMSTNRCESLTRGVVWCEPCSCFLKIAAFQKHQHFSQSAEDSADYEKLSAKYKNLKELVRKQNTAIVNHKENLRAMTSESSTLIASAGEDAKRQLDVIIDEKNKLTEDVRALREQITALEKGLKDAKIQLTDMERIAKEKEELLLNATTEIADLQAKVKAADATSNELEKLKDEQTNVNRELQELYDECKRRLEETSKELSGRAPEEQPQLPELTRSEGWAAFATQLGEVKSARQMQDLQRQLRETQVRLAQIQSSQLQKNTLLMSQLMRRYATREVPRLRFAVNPWREALSGRNKENLITLVDPQMPDLPSTGFTGAFTKNNLGGKAELDQLYNDGNSRMGNRNRVGVKMGTNVRPGANRGTRKHLIAFHYQLIRHHEVEGLHVEDFAREGNFHFALITDEQLQLFLQHDQHGRAYPGHVEIEVTGPTVYDDRNGVVVHDSPPDAMHLLADLHSQNISESVQSMTKVLSGVETQLAEEIDRIIQESDVYLQGHQTPPPTPKIPRVLPPLMDMDRYLSQTRAQNKGKRAPEALGVNPDGSGPSHFNPLAKKQRIAEPNVDLPRVEAPNTHYQTRARTNGAKGQPRAAPASVVKPASAGPTTTAIKVESIEAPQERAVTWAPMSGVDPDGIIEVSDSD